MCALRILSVVLLGVAAAAACGGPAPGEHGATAAVARAEHERIHVPDPQRIPTHALRNPGTPWGAYAGSAACRPCHTALYERWRGSFHSRTLYEANEHTVFGDFSGERTHAGAESPFVVRPRTQIDAASGKRRFTMDIERRRDAAIAADTYGGGMLPDLAAQSTFEVLYAFGNRQHQPYVARAQDGRHWVLPVYWDDARKTWRYDGFRPYIRACARCHVTGLRTAKRPGRSDRRPLPMTRPPRYPLEPAEEAWADGAVGCEACHGPGKAHIEAVEREGTEAYTAGLRAGTRPATIYDGKRASFRHQLDLCGQCHNFFTESPVTWAPGPDGFRRDPQYEPLTLGPTNVGFQFYADGSPMSPCTVVQVYSASKMYAEQITCTRCHDPHGTEHWADLLKPADDNTMCTACHEKLAGAAAQAAHSRHPIGSAGNRCMECHMARTMRFSNGVHAMSERIPSHAFDIPTGEQLPGGPPPSCNVCHSDKDAAWTRTLLARWREEVRAK